MKKNPDRGSGIRDEHPEFYLWELSVSFFGLKIRYSNSLMRFRILDPRSATLAIRVPTGNTVQYTVWGTFIDYSIPYLSTAVQYTGTQYKCLQYIRWYSVKPTLYKLPITIGVFTLYGSVLYINQYRTELEHTEYIHTYICWCLKLRYTLYGTYL